MKHKIMLAALATLAAVVTIGGCGSSHRTISGELSIHESVFKAPPQGIGESSCKDGSWNPAPGTQVTVKAPNGTVIGTGDLGEWTTNAPAKVYMAGQPVIYTCKLPFSVQNLPAESRYGFSVSGVPGTQWVGGNSRNVSLGVGQ